MEIKSCSVSVTETIGTELGKLLLPGDVVSLIGDLGAGKTAMVHGIARGLDVITPVSSPSYLIIQEYEGKWPVFHCDFYRLNTYRELEDIGWDDYLRQQGVILIEWGNRFGEALPEDYLKISIGPGETVSDRWLSFCPVGERYSELLRELSAKCAYWE